MSDRHRPARPPRRFSALKPPTVGVKPSETVELDTSPASDRQAPTPVLASVSIEKTDDQARIAKVMARAGVCSRREAEAWILEGRVGVNGTPLDSPAFNVGPDDAITVDGLPIGKPEKTRLFLFNKARGLVTTARDPEGRPTIYNALPADLPRLVTVGRLDINTEGLLLLTNDGGLARTLELPATGWIRRYRVRANGSIDQGRLDTLAKGIVIDGVAYAGIAAKLDRVQGANVWLTMGLKEGKNREIKRVLEHLGLAVTRLIRISFGPFQLGDLGDNAVEEVRTRVLRDQLGSALAKQAGVDFEGSSPTIVDAAPEPDNGGSRGSRVPRARARLDDQADGPRRQTRRTATQDRRGRAVAVERVATAKPARTEPSRGARTVDRRSRTEDVRTGRQRDGTAFEPRTERSRATGQRRDNEREQGLRSPRLTGDRPSRPEREQRTDRPHSRSSRGDRPVSPNSSFKPRQGSDQRPGPRQPPAGGGRPGGKGGGKSRPRR